MRIVGPQCNQFIIYESLDGITQAADWIRQLNLQDQRVIFKVTSFMDDPQWGTRIENSNGPSFSLTNISCS